VSAGRLEPQVGDLLAIEEHVDRADRRRHREQAYGGPDPGPLLSTVTA